MGTTTKVTNLVISFRGVFYELLNGNATQEDLDGALFYFGSTRKHVFDDHGDWDYEQFAQAGDPTAVEKAYRAIIEAVADGEARGRVVWRDFGNSGTLEQLNELLASNGLPLIDGNREEEFVAPLTAHYSLPGVVDAIKEQNLPYRVIGYR